MIKQILYSSILLCFSFNILAAESLANKVRQHAAHFVRSQVTAAKEQRIKVSASNIDPRTNFKSCKNFRYYLTTSEVKDNNTVRVTCQEDKSFRLYIPVQVDRLIPVITMKVTADKGDMLESNDLKIAYVNQNHIFGTHYSDKKELLGAKLKRRVNRDRPLTRYDICIVCRGDTVTIEAKGKGLYISTSGTALANGLTGDTIRVRNNQSKRTISAVINAVGQVTVRM